MAQRSRACETPGHMALHCWPVLLLWLCGSSVAEDVCGEACLLEVATEDARAASGPQALLQVRRGVPELRENVALHEDAEGDDSTADGTVGGGLTPVASITPMASIDVADVMNNFTAPTTGMVDTTDSTAPTNISDFNAEELDLGRTVQAKKAEKTPIQPAKLNELENLENAKIPPNQETPRKTHKPIKQDSPLQSEKPTKHKKTENASLPEKAAKQVKPKKSAKPVKQQKPAKAEKPTKPQKTNLSEKLPEKTDLSENLMKPAKLEKPTEQQKPEKPRKSHKPAKQAKREKPPKPEKESILDADIRDANTSEADTSRQLASASSLLVGSAEQPENATETLDVPEDAPMQDKPLKATASTDGDVTKPTEPLDAASTTDDGTSAEPETATEALDAPAKPLLPAKPVQAPTDGGLPNPESVFPNPLPPDEPLKATTSSDRNPDDLDSATATSGTLTMPPMPDSVNAETPADSGPAEPKVVSDGTAAEPPIADKVVKAEDPTDGGPLKTKSANATRGVLAKPRKAPVENHQKPNKTAYAGPGKPNKTQQQKHGKTTAAHPRKPNKTLKSTDHHKMPNESSSAHPKKLHQLKADQKPKKKRNAAVAKPKAALMLPSWGTPPPVEMAAEDSGDVGTDTSASGALANELDKKDALGYARGHAGCMTIEMAPESFWETWFESQPKAGAPCLFGVDARDEGKHCIMEEAPRFGPFGWCYTTEDLESWGSCGDGCPTALLARSDDHGRLRHDGAVPQ